MLESIPKSLEPHPMPVAPADPVAAFLEQHDILLLDGGLGTELERLYRPLAGEPLWSAEVLLEKPSVVQQLHRQFLEAGADCITTSSYQISRSCCSDHGLGPAQTTALLRTSARLALDARDEFVTERTSHRQRPLVAGSVGPYGAQPKIDKEYRGDYGLSRRQLMDYHRPHVEVLADTDVDLLAFETLPCQLEAEAIVRLLEEFPQRCAWLSFTVCDDRHTCHGEVFADCVAAVADHPQIVAVGCNCSPPSYLPNLIAAASEVTSTPIVVYPNSGEGFSVEKQAWTGEGIHADIEDHAALWRRNGARLLGGCCRTTTEDVRRLASWRDSR